MIEKIEIKEVILPLMVVVTLLLVFVPPIINNPIPRQAQLLLTEKHFQSFRKLDIVRIESPTDQEKILTEVMHYVSNHKTLRDEKRVDHYSLMMRFPDCFVIERSEKLLEINMCGETEWKAQHFELLDYLIETVTQQLVKQYPKKIRAFDQKTAEAYSKIEVILE